MWSGEIFLRTFLPYPPKYSRVKGGDIIIINKVIIIIMLDQSKNETTTSLIIVNIFQNATVSSLI